MTFTVIVPSAIAPAGAAPDPLSDIELPGLSRLAAHAAVTRIADGVIEALATAAGVPRETDWALAPLAARAEALAPAPGDAAPDACWLFATPVRAALSHADALLASATLAVDAAETESVLADLNALFAADGVRFLRGPATGQWFARAARPVRIRTRAPASAIGQSLRLMLPEGDDAPDWRRWISEIQMLLHGHAVNAAREARGAAPIDALWFWGAGREGAGSSGTGRTAWADDPLVAAVLAGAGCDVRPLAQAAEKSLAGETPDGIVWIDALARALDSGDIAAWREAWRVLDRTWLVPAAARGERGAGVELVAGGDVGAMRIVPRARPALSRLALWRRAPPAAALLAQWREPTASMARDAP
jgi:hypothetical protein